jgi:hypothetical protein
MADIAKGQKYAALVDCMIGRERARVPMDVTVIDLTPTGNAFLELHDLERKRKTVVTVPLFTLRELVNSGKLSLSA